MEWEKIVNMNKSLTRRYHYCQNQTCKSATIFRSTRLFILFWFSDARIQVAKPLPLHIFHAISAIKTLHVPRTLQAPSTILQMLDFMLDWLQALHLQEFFLLLQYIYSIVDLCYLVSVAVIVCRILSRWTFRILYQRRSRWQHTPRSGHSSKTRYWHKVILPL